MSSTLWLETPLPGWPLFFVLLLAVAACEMPGGSHSVRPSPDKALTLSPTATPTSTDPGRDLFQQIGCSFCHGPWAEGHVAPRLAGTALSFESVVRQVRTPRAMMPPFKEKDVSDEQLEVIYRWLRTLPASR